MGCRRPALAVTLPVVADPPCCAVLCCAVLCLVQGYGVDVLDMDESRPSDGARKSGEAVAVAVAAGPVAWVGGEGRRLWLWRPGPVAWVGWSLA